MLFFDRHVNKTIKRHSKRKSTIIITGPRQVGKTTALKNLFPDTKYVTLDDPVLRLSAQENSGAFIAENPSPIIIDEIQKAPVLFDYIKMNVDQTANLGQYFLTGSHSFDLMRGVSESLAGRAGIIKMLGLSLRELTGSNHTLPFLPEAELIKSRSQSGKAATYNEIANIIHKGSFPELYKLESDLDDWRDYYSSYLQSYLEKDVKDLIRVDNMSSFTKFLRGVAAISGELLNASSLARIAEVSVHTVKSWLSILEMSGHIYLLQPYHNNHNKRLVKSPKIYLLDTGLLCFLSGWNTPEQLLRGARWGHIFETFVISEILKGYYSNGQTYPPLYFYRDKDGVEVDLVIESGDTLYPVEIKVTTNPTKSMVSGFRALNKIPGKKVGDGAVVCMHISESMLTLVDGVRIISPNGL